MSAMTWDDDLRGWEADPRSRGYIAADGERPAGWPYANRTIDRMAATMVRLQQCSLLTRANPQLLNNQVHRKFAGLVAFQSTATILYAAPLARYWDSVRHTFR